MRPADLLDPLEPNCLLDRLILLSFSLTFGTKGEVHSLTHTDSKQTVGAQTPRNLNGFPTSQKTGLNCLDSAIRETSSSIL